MENSVEKFLVSEEVVFVYKNAFGTINEAKRWIRKYAGSKMSYSFTAIARKSENGVEVILQKGTEIFEKEKESYFNLMSELGDLTNQLKTFPKFLSKLKSFNCPLTPAEETN